MIVVSQDVTLGAVIQAPAGDEGIRGGGWAGLIEGLRLGRPDRK